MRQLEPEALYESPLDEKPVVIVPGNGPHTTDGVTTQISDVVVKAGGKDRDKPSTAKNTEMGHLRATLTTLQDKINIFLTERMKQNDESQDIKAFEKHLQDDGGEEISDSE